MRKLVVFERVTLDGVFDADTMDQWDFPTNSDERLACIRDAMLASDIYLLGKTTYEMLAPGWSKLKNNEFGIADKINSIAKVVVSSTLKKADWNNSTIIKGDAIKAIAKLKQQPGGDILVHGSAILVQSLMHADLIDEYQLLVHPFVMGRGKRFFKDETTPVKLKLVETRTFPLGVMLLRYEPAKNERTPS